MFPGPFFATIPPLKRRRFYAALGPVSLYLSRPREERPRVQALDKGGRPRSSLERNIGGRLASINTTDVGRMPGPAFDSSSPFLPSFLSFFFSFFSLSPPSSFCQPSSGIRGTRYSTELLRRVLLSPRHLEKISQLFFSLFYSWDTRSSFYRRSRIVGERVIAAYAPTLVSYRRLLSNGASNLHPFVNNICPDGICRAKETKLRISG